MKIDNLNVNETIENARLLLGKENNLSPAFRSVFEIILMMLQLMAQRLSLNSTNSGKPPSTDPNRKKFPKQERGKSNRKPGGQPGRTGKQLKPVENPDIIEEIKIDKATLPKGNYTDGGFEARQVIDFSISAYVTEYRAQIVFDEHGKRYVADFPSHIPRPIQYGPKTKAAAVYMSQYQLTPYNRVLDYFAHQVGLNISTGSLFNFNKEAFEQLARFEEIAKLKLLSSPVINADETGVNINGKRIWLHTACNDKWTHFYPHQKRGTEAINAIGILPNFKGVLCHDSWKAYYKYDCEHALCNAHILRELEWSATEDKQKWALKIKTFLTKLNETVDKTNGKLSSKDALNKRRQFKGLLTSAEKECPLHVDLEAIKARGRRGRLKQSKSRNLLDRLIKYQKDVLRFIDDENVPFTNNQGENDLRMTKVQQKISGCFRSMEGALIFCRVRGYLISCRKHDIGPTEALEILFKGELPHFVYVP